MEKITEKHPSFGLVSFSRIHGKAHLVGSGVEHNNFIALKISRADIYRSYGEEKYLNNTEDLIEVWLSAAQFSELLTNMNCMPGTPCTIRNVCGKPQEPPPYLDTKLKIAQEYVEKQHAEFANKIKIYNEKANAILSKNGAINLKYLIHVFKK